jgi:hypothetical protein
VRGGIDGVHIEALHRFPVKSLLGERVDEARLTSEVPVGSRFEQQWPAIEGLAPTSFIESTTHAFEGDEPVGALDLGMLAPPGPASAC